MRCPPRLLICGLTASLLAACNGPAAPAAKAEAKAATTPEATPASTDPQPDKTPPTKVPASTGFAYLSVENVGVYRLDDRGLHLYVPSRTAIADLLELDGGLYLLSAFGVQRPTGANQVETVAAIEREDFAKLGSLIAFGSADGREFWVAGSEGVGRYDGAWTITPLPELDASAAPAASERSIDLAVTSTGVPWLLADTPYQHLDGGWKPVEPGSAAVALWPDPGSDAMILHAGCVGDPSSCTLTRQGQGAAKHDVIPAGDCREFPELALSSNGTRAVLGGRCGLLRLRLDSPELAPELLPASAEGWDGQPLRSLAIDALGRIWIGTNDGLTLIEADASAQNFPIAALIDMSGPVTGVLVSGEGPPPPTLGQLRTGGLKATIVTEVEGAKQPLPGAKVELCSRLPVGGELPPDPARSPCAGVEPTYTTVSDDQGTFVIESLPLSHYYVGVEIDGRWARGAPKALHMRAGMTGNVGKIVVAVPE